MYACKGQVALRGLPGFLSLEQIWIILPHGEKEIFCIEVMAAIPKAKYWFKTNDIYFRTLTQNSDWADASVFWAPTRANDYWLRLLPSSALPVSLSLSTTSPLKSHCKESPKGSWSLVSSPHLQHSNKELLWLFVIATTMATFIGQSQPVKWIFPHLTPQV